MNQIPSYEESSPVPSETKRIDWWQRLVDLEQGLTAGFRANSALFFYFFTTSVLLSFSVVLGLSGIEWALVLLGTSIALGSELLCFSIQKITTKWKQQLDEETRQLLSIAAAACMLLLTGAILTIVIVLANRVCELYA